jgi:hypothetical protein
MNKKEKLNDTPWQFEPGDVVYIAGHKQQPAKVTAAFGRTIRLAVLFRV